ncbi:hypothetical protein [Streptomyces sp. YGL11-2]|uniref:hypothetical protein n=1 Tax=Streptomyces sp. YGL11-2 TaxID=3414028 RepID=UPI003CF48E72
MTGVCACCGRTGRIESHHIGGWRHSDITIDVCPDCHNALTIADVHERTWTSSDAVQRIGLAIIDLAARAYESAGLPVEMAAAHGMILALRETAGFTYRPSSAMAEEPGTVAHPDTARQMESLWAAYTQFCEASGKPATSFAAEAFIAFLIWLSVQ